MRLPTYAFQRERYWLLPGPGAADTAAIGLTSTGHPLLGGAVALADDGGWLFTGRLSLQSHPWLADHAVLGSVLLPGTAFLDLALCAGERVGCAVVRELTLEAPLFLGKDDAVQIQLAVGACDEDGRRSLVIHSRPESGSVEDGLEEESWTRHTSGSLVSAKHALNGRAASVAERSSALTGQPWPPREAEAIEVDDLYDALMDMGFEYGPAFQGLRAAWRRGEDLFAEVALSSEQRDGAARFGMHPALLDSALHVGLCALVDGATREPGHATGGVRMPFSFNGVELHAPGAGSLRVSLSSLGDDEISLLVADDAGGLVASVDSLVVRKVSASQLERPRTDADDSLFRLDWREIPVPVQPSVDGLALLGDEGSPLADALGGGGADVAVYASLDALRDALDAGVPPPRSVFYGCAPGRVEVAGERAVGVGVGVVTGVGEHDRGDDGGEPALARDCAHRTLELIQGWLSEERLADSHLVLLTEGAVAVRAGEAPTGLAQAPVWGLVRSAQSENPERFTLIDTDGSGASRRDLASALSTGESQLAMREGTILAPRLARVGGGDLLKVPEGVGEWRLSADDSGTLEGLSLVPAPESAGALEPGQVRIAVRAGGLNFRDVLIALDMYPDAATIGSEGAGVVLELGPGVEDLAVGDRVMGLLWVESGRSRLPTASWWHRCRRDGLCASRRSADRISDRLLRARRSGRAQSGRACTGACGNRRRGHGRGAVGAASGRRCVRDRESGEVGSPAFAGIRRSAHRLVSLAGVQRAPAR